MTVWPPNPIPGNLDAALALDTLSPLDLVSPSPANRQVSAIAVDAETLRVAVNETIALTNVIPSYFVERDGESVTQFLRGNLDMNGNYITNLADAIDAGDLVTLNARDIEMQRVQDIGIGFDKNWYLRHNGTLPMLANLDLGGNRVRNLAPPLTLSSAVSKFYADEAFKPSAIDALFMRRVPVAVMAGALAMGSHRITNLGSPITDDYMVRLLDMTAAIPTVPSPEPAGIVREWGGAWDANSWAVPTGWVLCNGQTLQQSWHDELYAVIGDTFTASPNQTTYQVPDLRGRTPAHIDPGNWGSNEARLRSAPLIFAGTAINVWAGSMGGVGGLSYNVLDATQLGRHNHHITHASWSTVTGGNYAGDGSSGAATWKEVSIGSSGTGYTSYAGGGIPPVFHQNTQPTIFVGYIIKLVNA